MISNYSDDCAEWYDVFASQDSELAILSTVEARAAMISLVTGKETNSCFTPNCHITMDLSPMYGIKQLAVDEIFDANHSGIIRFDSVPSYVSGSLLIGSVSSEYPTLQHLKPVQDFEVDRTGLVKAEEAAKIANLYRLFGHQVTIEHFRSGELYPVYANSSDSVIAVYELFGRARTFDIMRVNSSYPREGRHTDIPSASHLLTYGKCHIAFDMPVIDVCAWMRRKTVHRPIMMLESRRVPTKFNVGATSGFEKTRLLAFNKTGIRRQDFHEAPTELAPSIPAVRGMAATTQPIVMSQEEDLVGDVE